MNIALSIRGALLQEADRVARKLGLTRSRLFSLALQDYLRHRQKDEILDQLNQVYTNALTSAERRKAAKMKDKFCSTIQDVW